jgi:xanthine phosphoribosyltransferase
MLKNSISGVFFASLFICISSLVAETAPQKLMVSSDQVQTLCMDLYHKIKSDNFVPDFLVGLSRGGLVPLGFLAGEQMFDNRATKIINVKSYTKSGCQTALRMFMPAHLEDLQNARSILIIDDLVDSGKTMSYVFDLFKRTFPTACIKTATLFYKKSSTIKPDYFVQETDDWVVFPWE